MKLRKRQKTLIVTRDPTTSRVFLFLEIDHENLCKKIPSLSTICVYKI